MDNKFICFICLDCKVNTHEIHEYYMVQHSLWHSLGLKNRDGMLCIGCLENRLGRELNSKDFIDYPINTNPTYVRSNRLKDRLKNDTR